jgi:hypothetical protein
MIKELELSARLRRSEGEMPGSSLRVCAAGATLKGLLAALLLGPLSLAAQTTPIYVNAVEPGWQNWTWGTTVNFANGSPAQGGSGTSISVRYDAAWAGFYLHSTTNVSTAGFQTLRFSIHGGTTGGQALRLVAYDAALNEGGDFAVPAPAPGTWQQIDVPVAAFAVSTLSGLVWQDTSGSPQPAYYLDNIMWVGSGPGGGGGLQLSIDAAAGQHPISPDIYGINFGDQALAADLDLPVRRWGGNATTRYNWQLDTSNRASDWFFENIPNDNPNPAALPDGSSSDDFVDQDQSVGTSTIMTVPLIGWTPKARAFDCGFRVSLYGAQQSTDPWQPDCGNGVAPGGQDISGNNPADTSTAIGPSFVQGWVAHLSSRYGTAAEGGVRFYNLDNEPMLWHETHRDVHPQPVSYDELRDRTLLYAGAIKDADPTAATLGPVLWGWTAYFWSAADAAAGGDWWNNPPDRLAHGNIPFVEWYLQQMQLADQQQARRLLDYLDLHNYPQAPGVALAPAGSSATQALRLRSTRSLWDPTYVDESWIAEPVRLIPRMRDWVDQNYPGTKLAITEYNWGGHEHINGALAQADVLGIFGREGLDLATLWDPPAFGEPAAFALRMYRNYDGGGSRFGATAVQAASSDQGQVSIYAALRSYGDLTAMLINKSLQNQACTLNLSGFSPAGPAAVYRYSGQDVGHIVAQPDLALGSPSTALSVPASSITLLVIPGAAAPQCSTPADCADATVCNGTEQCVAGTCQPGTPLNCNDGSACTTDGCNAATGCTSQPINCGDADACTVDSCSPASGCAHTPIVCPPGSACTGGTCQPLLCNDNGTCAGDEDCNNCPQDCGSSPGGGICGNGVCEPPAGEDCLGCPGDCNGKQSGTPNKRFCCGDGAGQNPVGCSDPRCTVDAFECSNTVEAPSCCGDGACTGPESPADCASDCGAGPACPDGTCDPGENPCTCPQDCGPGAETNCADANDNDCDGQTDCADGDCAGDPACAPAGCDADGTCESGEDCLNCAGDCPGKLSGPPAKRYCCGNGVAEPAEGGGAICDGNF